MTIAYPDLHITLPPNIMDMSLTNSSASSSSSPTPPPASSFPSDQIPAAPMATNARGNARRPPKLRSSCDACGAAKVRCDKAHPRCGRCVSGGLTCVYGLSRKFGKAPRKKPPTEQQPGMDNMSRSMSQTSFANSMAGCMPDMRRFSEQSTSSFSSGSDTFNFDDLSFGMGNYTARDLYMTPTPPLETPLDGTFSFNTPSMGFSSEPCGTVNPLNLSFSPTSEFQSYSDWLTEDLMSSSTDSLDLDAELSSSSHSSHSYARPQQRSSSISMLSTPLLIDGTHDCHRLAYSTLESLSFRGDSLLGMKGQNKQTMDQVLNRNKSALNNLQQLLRCPCSKSAHLAMLYASITSKILMWYQLAAGCSKTTSTPSSWDYLTGGAGPTPPLSATNSPTTAAAFGGSSPPRFSLSPVQTFSSTNAFGMDDEVVQDSLRRQLLLTELKKAGSLIDALTMQGSVEGSATEVNDIYLALGTWLKSELNRTLAQITC